MKEKFKKIGLVLLAMLIVTIWVLAKNSGNRENDLCTTKITIKALLNNDSISKKFEVPTSISSEIMAELNQKMSNKKNSLLTIIDENYYVSKVDSSKFIAMCGNNSIVISKQDSSERVFIQNQIEGIKLEN